MPATGIVLGKPAEFAQVTDLLDAYFDALRAYNRELGAFEMSAEQLRDAREREALSYARVRTLKAQLIERAIAV